MIVDDMPLRRGAYMRLLEPWAARQKLELVEATLLAEDLQNTQPTMIIISAGGRSIADLRLQNRLPDGPESVPVTVVISDLEDPREVIAALKSGLRAFIPTTLTEEMAFTTLSFVLSGGEYFPISALQARGSIRNSGNEKPQ